MQRAMDDPRAQRTLVKSPPELWAEVSDVEALAGHLGAFGEIRITRLEPETTVAWEGDRARGTVALESAGWGTRVTLTARIAAEPAVAEPEPDPEPEAATPAATPEPEPEREASAPVGDPAAAAPEGPRRWWWPFGRRRAVAAVPIAEPEPEPAGQAPPAAQAEVQAEPEPEPTPPGPRGGPLDPERAEAILSGVLDDLGAARHRPFSRG
jgi:hypothetical protein